jgi:hypothetical protein
VIYVKKKYIFKNNTARTEELEEIVGRRKNLYSGAVKHCASIVGI